MGGLCALTLRLDPDDYERLRQEAERLGVAPATLVRMYVRSKLRGDDAESKRRQLGLSALDRLSDLTVGLPKIDAVQIANEARGELERRLDAQ